MNTTMMTMAGTGIVDNSPNFITTDDVEFKRKESYDQRQEQITDYLEQLKSKDEYYRIKESIKIGGGSFGLVRLSTLANG